MNIAGAIPIAAKYQNENVAGLSNQRHKIGFKPFMFRKMTSILEKM